MALKDDRKVLQKEILDCAIVVHDAIEKIRFSLHLLDRANRIVTLKELIADMEYMLGNMYKTLKDLEERK